MQSSSQFAKLLAKGCKVSVVSTVHLSELEAEIENRRNQSEFDEGFIKEYLFRFRFASPEELTNATIPDRRRHAQTANQSNFHLERKSDSHSSCLPRTRLMTRSESKSNVWLLRLWHRRLQNRYAHSAPETACRAKRTCRVRTKQHSLRSGHGQLHAFNSRLLRHALRGRPVARSADDEALRRLQPMPQSLPNRRNLVRPFPA